MNKGRGQEDTHGWEYEQRQGTGRHTGLAIRTKASGRKWHRGGTMNKGREPEDTHGQEYEQRTKTERQRQNLRRQNDRAIETKRQNDSECTSNSQCS